MIVLVILLLFPLIYDLWAIKAGRKTISQTIGHGLFKWLMVGLFGWLTWHLFFERVWRGLRGYSRRGPSHLWRRHPRKPSDF